MNIPFHQIMTYTEKETQKTALVRTAAQEKIKTLPGFMTWTTFFGADDPTRRADLITWSSFQHAQAAIETIETTKQFTEFRALTIISPNLATMNTMSPPLIKAGEGIELGYFRLKSGIHEETVRNAHRAMIARYLSHQPGWRRQQLVKLDNGVFVDIAFADGRSEAETLCASWLGQHDCEAFLALIEPESMTFGTVL